MARITAQQIRTDFDRHAPVYIASAYTADETIEKEFDSREAAASWLKALIALMNMDTSKVDGFSEN